MEPRMVDLVVLGSGPGGYAAAFDAADRGRRVVLVEQDPHLGGVCLHRGCIPSKALLHATSLMREAKHSGSVRGISVGAPRVDLEKLRAWKQSILGRLEQGVRGLAQRRGVEVLQGRGHFEDSHTLRVETAQGPQRLQYQHAIIAVGSKPALPKPFEIGHPRVMTSTEALELPDIPQRLLVVGGGYIGLELATVYAALGSQIVLVEATDRLLRGVDDDLVRPVVRALGSMIQEIRLSTTVVEIAAQGAQVQVTCEGSGPRQQERYDRVLVAVGRAPNCDELGLEHTKVQRTPEGFIKVDTQQQTDDPTIWAIGDVVGGALLAHKASHEARVALEAITGEPSGSERTVIPAVVFTDPELAWCGLTEIEAKAQDIPVAVARFPWSASGRALTLDRTDGMTKLLIDPSTERLLGVGIVGVEAGELISEGALAVQTGASAKDLARVVHPHPTLSETLMEAAQMFYGTARHAVAPRRQAVK